MLSKGSPCGGQVKLIYELIEDLETYDAVVHGRLQELGHLLDDLPVLRIVEPPQLGDTRYLSNINYNFRYY